MSHGLISSEMALPHLLQNRELNEDVSFVLTYLNQNFYVLLISYVVLKVLLSIFLQSLC